MSNKLHDKGEHFLLTPKAEPLLERVIFNNRLVILLVFMALTVFLGFNAAHIKPDASFERLIPLEHPFIKNMMANRSDLENLGNTLRIVVAVKNGDIFTKEYMDVLHEINDEVFNMKNEVDRSGMKSLWTPNVRWVEVTEEGFQGGTVIPDGYDGSPATLDALRQNILRSGEMGRLVADNFKSSSIMAPLFEVSPETHQRLDYQKFSQDLEKLRAKYQAKYPNIEIHLVGFAKKVGDLIAGVSKIGLFFLAAIIITTVLLFWYSRCLAGTLVPVTTSIIAVIWQLGILHVLGYGLDPYSVLVPFLVFAIGISHGVQIVNAMALEAAKGYDALTAARLAFRSLYIAGLVALLSDAIGFLTLLFIKIDVIKDLAMAAGIGVAVVIVTNLILHPVIMSYIGISKSGVRHVQNHDDKADRKWRIMSYFAHPSVAPISVLIAILGFALGQYYQKDLKIGDLDKGAPELRANSRYNLDNQYVIDNYSTSSDVFVVMVKTPPEKCTDYHVLDAMDRLQWILENTPGVQSTGSLVTFSKIVTKALNEGSLKWFDLPRNQQVINSTIRNAPAGLINTNCSMTPLIAFLEDHKAETLETVTNVIEDFAKKNNSDQFQFLLAAGNGGVEAATNQVIERANNMMLIFVYAVVTTLCLITFRSIRATLCLMVPLGLTSVLCQALMAQFGIGIKVATLPVIALGVGIGVDYGIYIYAQLEKFLLEGKPLQEAYFETLRSTGKAVCFTGMTLAIGVCTWVLSPIKFQADMGWLLTFMFLWNMVGALWLLPAMARFLLRPEKMVAKARAAEAKL